MYFDSLDHALLQTFQIWTWLAKHPDKDKQDWPQWEVLKDMPYHCPCCNYAQWAMLGEMKSCLFCPLFGFWPSNTHCAEGNSPYAGWRNVGRMTEESRKRRSKYAKDIALEAFRRWILSKGDSRLYSKIKWDDELKEDGLVLFQGKWIEWK